MNPEGEREGARLSSDNTPTVCCACSGRMRPADAEEMQAIAHFVELEKRPPELFGYVLVAGRLCVACGGVSVLMTNRRHRARVWCPGFELHVTSSPGRTL